MKLRYLLLILLLWSAEFLRLYRIDDFTQFRGDQGVAGVVIYDALKNHTLPLTGPTVSTGELPGPAYYYLIALPLILSNFNPLVPAILFAVMGVVTVLLLYYVGRRMFGVVPGFVIASLYAISPAIVEQNRNMWNPTAIPFFVTLIIFSLYKIHEKKFIYLLLASFSLGVLIQLHYTNAFWAPWIAGFWIYEFLRSKNTGFFKMSFAAIGAFLFPLLPFLYYEVLHQFIDIRQVATMLFVPREGIAQTRLLTRALYIISRVFFPVFPTLELPAAYVPFFLLFIPVFLKKNVWAIYFSAMVLSSAVILSLYKGPFFDQYLWFFLPLPFFIVGYAVSRIPKKFQAICAIILVSYVTYVYIPRFHLTETRIGEITQTQMITDAMIKESQNKPFSFALIASASYSDSHYRYYFHIRGRDPLPISSNSSSLLFLVCGAGHCPPYPFSRAEDMKNVQVYCYDMVCRGIYPKIDLAPYAIVKANVVAGATIYTYKRI